MTIGTFAYCGSGQDTLADSFCKYLGFHKFSLGDVIRNIARERNLPEKREVLQNIRAELDTSYGREFIPLALLKVIRNSGYNKIIITGIRTREEYRIFSQHLGMRLLFVYADEDIRYKRMIARKEAKDEGSVKQLRINMRRENELFDYECLKPFAIYKYNFNMPIDEYRSKELLIIKNLYSLIERNQ